MRRGLSSLMGGWTLAGEVPRYRFGPLERRGLVAGWRGGQIAAVAGAMVVAVGILRAWPSPGGALVAFMVVAGGTALACWPVGGRTPEQWLPLVARWLAKGLVRRRRHISTVPGLGRTGAAGSTGRGSASAVPPPPGPLAGCRILQMPVRVGGRRIGVVRDGRIYAGVVAVRGRTFALLDAEDKHRRVAAWAGVMAGLAREGSAVHRLQWVERSLPLEAGPASQGTGEGAGPVGPATSPARSYAALLAQSGPVAQQHQVLLIVAVNAARSARAIQAAGGGDEGACAVVEEEIRALEARLRTADVTVEGALAPGALVDVLRQAIDSRPVPARGTHRAPSAGGDTGDDPGIDARSPWPWPLATEVNWSAYRTDGTWHATYWVAEWPRVEVGPDFLSPLLLQAGTRRTMALVMEPMSPLRAAREVERARTADVADAELRRRSGFLQSARRRREQEGVVQRERELADGHAHFRFSGYVTVSAGSQSALETACRQVEQVAGQGRLEFRRLYGEQDVAFTWTLPLGRGLS